MRLPIHPLERAVLAMVALNVVFLPWALAGNRWWGQAGGAVIALAGFCLAMIPRYYSSHYSNGPEYLLNPWPRLFKFPLFWIGLALHVHVLIQAGNPSWQWERNDQFWWLRRVNDIPWLPTSIDTPFEHFNIWRQLMIYAAAWLTVCTVWVGFTRQRTIELLLWIMAANAAILAIAGLALRVIWHRDTVLWTGEFIVGAQPFASFIGKNQAGAWLGLMAAVFVFLAVARHQRSQRHMERSSPAILYLLGLALLIFAEVITLSRGGALLLLIYLLGGGGVYLVHDLLAHAGPRGPRLVPVSVLAMILGVAGITAYQLNSDGVQRGLGALFQGKTADPSVEQRLDAYQAGTDMLAAHWQRGVGAGGFRFLFPTYLRKYPGAYQKGQVFWEHAHRDWLEIPIEQGIAGSGLILAGGLYWLWAALKRKVWRDLPALLLAIGLLQTLAHAWFDFPFQSTAILVTWGLLAILIVRRLDMEAV